MQDLGRPSDEDLALAAWFKEQQSGNLARLEEGARTIIQLIGALYTVIFGILAFSKEPVPAYLRDLAVRWLGSVSLAAFFLALLAALVVVYPRRTAFEEGNLSAMRQAVATMQRIKSWGLRLALWLFLIGMGCLGGLIGRILWTL